MDTYGGAENLTSRSDDDLLSVSQAAKLLGYSVSTLQRWDREGILRAQRTPTNQRRYRRGDLLSIVRAA